MPQQMQKHSDSALLARYFSVCMLPVPDLHPKWNQSETRGLATAIAAPRAVPKAAPRAASDSLR